MSDRRFRIPRFYKTLLMLALVFGPFYWLAFTEDGQHRTDLALMFVLRKPQINPAMDRFTDRFAEQDIRETFPALRFQCADGRNPFGRRLCAAELGAFNGIPASSLTLFFDADRLRAAKLLYRRAYHEAIGDWVRARVVAQHAADDRPPPRPAITEGVAAWPVTEGLLVLRDGPLGEDDEPALLWLSSAVAGGMR